MTFKPILPFEKLNENELPREAFETLVLEGYSSGHLSDVEVAQMLNLSISETDEFLKNRGLFAFGTFEEIKPDSFIP